MRVTKVILAVILPPLAVWDKGCGTVLLVGVLTMLAWIPGVLAAMFIVWRDFLRTSPGTEDRSADIFSAAQQAKNQPLYNRPPQAFDTQQAEARRPPDEDDQPPAAPPTIKPPWES